jgi:biopolymer transport protein ExbD
MGGVDVDTGGGKKRSVSADLNLVPYIDFLMVLVAFLLITAVWTTNSRINADAQVPGPPNPEKELTPQTPEKVLNLHVLESEFALVWKQGSTVVSEYKMPKPESGETAIRYPDLAKQIAKEWETHGGHRDPSDRKLDQAILHVDNRLAYKEIIAVLDALYSPKREVKLGEGPDQKVPVFNMTFSVR